MKAKFMEFLTGLAEGMIIGFFVIQTENMTLIRENAGKNDAN